MIEAAEAKIDRQHSYVTAEDGRFQVYLTPVEQRTRAMKPHYRVGYYMYRRYRWLLDLSCGHMVVKVQASNMPPQTMNCYYCAKDEGTA